MRLAVLSFTEQGGKLNCSLCRGFQERGLMADSFEKRKGEEKAPKVEGETPLNEAERTVIPFPIEKTLSKRGDLESAQKKNSSRRVEGSLREWTKKAFDVYDGLIFVGACGIAVRAIAPFLKDKFTDPAVVVVDEGARFAVSLLSGHVGGANDLCILVAELSGAVPVISTATDLNGRFAVDVFAKKNGLFLLDRRLAKEVSAAILSGKRIPFFSTSPFLDEPSGDLKVLESVEKFLQEPGLKIAVSEYRLQEGSEYGIVSERVLEQEEILYLVPKTVTVGMGCKRGTKQNHLRAALETSFQKAGIFPEALAGIATIEDKKEEKGLIELANDLEVPFFWYDKEELLALPGEFSHSDFVEQTVGVGCVCERAAVLGSDGGKLIFQKQAGGGVTIAAAAGKKKLLFGKEADSWKKLAFEKEKERE